LESAALLLGKSPADSPGNEAQGDLFLGPARGHLPADGFEKLIKSI
jgi:hypothetical protein